MRLNNMYSALLHWKVWLVPSSLAVALLIVSQYNYLLFHTLAELFPIVVGAMMFVIALYTQPFSRQYLLTFLAAGYFWVAGMDLVHTLVYKGMGIYPIDVANHSAQFWITSRYMEAILLFLAPLALKYWEPSMKWTFSIFGTVSVLAYLSIMFNYFPDAYVDGTGLTDFKIVSEYVICFILLAALFNFYAHKEVLEDGLFPFISASITLTVFAELAFTSYVSIYGPANVLGHILKMFSFWLIFYSIVRVSLQGSYKDLLKSEARFKSIVESMSDLVWEVDVKGVYTYCSPKLASTLGCRVDEVIGKTPFDFMSPEESIRVGKIFFETVANKKSIQNLGNRNITKKGQKICLLTNGAPIFDADGEVLGYRGVDTDITTQKGLEEKLHQAQKMEAVGTLVGGIAHDFNNMLAGMTGNLYLAKKHSENPDVLDKLTNVEKLSFQASEMIRQLLVFARKGEVEMKPFNLTAFVKEIIKITQLTVPENVSFKMDVCQEELLINGEPTQIQQVLMNLIKNSNDALDNRKKPFILLKLESFVADASFKEMHPDINETLFAKLTVEDNGSGINEKVLHSIFDPFFTTKEAGKGTGLGLAMSYGTIKSHNGVIEVQSTPEQGTSFDVYLPLLREGSLAIESESTTFPIEGNGETILLVDDDLNLRTSNKEVLESLNYKVYEASNGLEAINIFGNHQQEIELIIMDVVMPSMSGVEAMEQINKLNSSIKVIYCTGYDKTGALGNLMPQESVVISKPYTVSSFSQEIKRVISS